MPDQPDNTNGRMERLLRHWGAEESLRGVQVGRAPHPKAAAEKARRPRRIGRWVPAAAAAALLAAAGVVYLSGGGGDGSAPVISSRMTATSQQLEDQKKQYEKDLASARERIQTLTDDLERERSALAGAESRYAILKGELARLQAAPSATEEVRKEFQAKLDARDTEVGRLKGELQTQESALTAARRERSDAAESLAGAQKRLSAALEELANSKAISDEAIASRQKATVELNSLRARNQVMQAEFQRMYLSLAGGDEMGLGARRKAAAGARMLERLAAVRSTLQSDSAKALADRLEVVLTRLELIDPYDRESAAGFAKLVRDSRVLSQMDEALAAGSESPALRDLLIEAKLILMGADRVG